MENFKGTDGHLSMAEDHRSGSTYNQYIIMAGTTTVVTISRQNLKEVNAKFKEKGLLNPDPKALANAHLFLAAKDMHEALKSLLDVVETNYDGSDEVITAIQKKQILKAKAALKKANGYV